MLSVKFHIQSPFIRLKLKKELKKFKQSLITPLSKLWINFQQKFKEDRACWARGQRLRWLIDWQRQPLGVFCKKDVLRNFAEFTGKHLCLGLFFNKVASVRPTTLLKKRFWHRCFPVNFAKFLRTPFWQDTSGWLLLDWHDILERFLLTNEFWN